MTSRTFVHGSVVAGVPREVLREIDATGVYPREGMTPLVFGRVGVAVCDEAGAWVALKYVEMASFQTDSDKVNARNVYLTMDDGRSVRLVCNIDYSTRLRDVYSVATFLGVSYTARRLAGR